MKKFFEVQIGNSTQNEEMYKFLMKKGFIGTTSIEPASQEVVSKIASFGNLDLTNRNVYKVTQVTGETVFVIERTHTNTIDVTYQEFLAWLEEENLVEDLDMGYSDYLEENNLTPNEQQVITYGYEVFDPSVILNKKRERIEMIEKEYKILEILKLEYAEIQALFS